MDHYRPEALVLLAAGAGLTAMAGAHALGGNHGASVVTGLGAIVSFVVAVLVTRSDRRRPSRPGDRD